MKSLVAIYVVIGLITGICFKLFGSYSYMPTSYNLGRGLVWPVSMFADDPEIDGSTRESFGLSYAKVLNSHQKMEGQFRLNQSMNLLALLSYAEVTPTFDQAEYDKLYKSIGHSFTIASEIMKRPEVLDNLRTRVDGMDFADILDEGEDAPEQLKELLASRPKATPSNEPEPESVVRSDRGVTPVRVIQVRDNRTSTVAGDLVVAEDSSETAKTLWLNGSALESISDDHISLLTVYRYADRDVVLFTHSCGGSACSFTSLGLLVVTNQRGIRFYDHKDFVIAGDGEEPEVRVGDNGGLTISFVGFSGPSSWKFHEEALTKL